MAYNKWFVDALEVMRDVADRKNDDYADDHNPYSNFEGAAALTGQTVEQVLFTLIGVKAERLRQLNAGKLPNNESKQDSVMDLAVYAALWLSWLIKEDQLELQPPFDTFTLSTESEEEAWKDYLQLKPEQKTEAERYIDRHWGEGFNADQGVYLGPRKTKVSGGTENNEEG